MDRITGIIASVFAFLGIALGAFGAHALKEELQLHNSTDVWKTAVDYQMWHSLALLGCSFLTAKRSFRIATNALFCTGIILFSGSLYGLALDGPRWLGPVTPLGGLSFMGGWIALGIGFAQRKD